MNAFRDEKAGAWNRGDFEHAWALYAPDIFFTFGVVRLSTALIGVLGKIGS